MRILYHHRTRGGDAQGIHIREIIEAMRGMGHEVHVASLVKESPPDGQKEKQNRRIESGGKRGALAYEIMTLLYNIYGLPMLVWKAIRYSPEMMYERYSLNTFCGILTSKIFRIPLVLEVNAPLSYEQKKYELLAFPSLVTALERWICSRSSRTIVVSQVMKNMLQEIGVPEDHMVVVPNGINPEVFHPMISGESVRRQWGLGDRTVLGFVGWFRKWHGLSGLIEIFSQELRVSGKLHLLLVGDGPARKEIENRVEELGLANHVTITGPVPRNDITRYIAAIDICLQPDVTEYASPMKIFEYMGMGKCVVAPDQENIREILVNGRTALLFKPGSRNDMMEAIQKAVRDPVLRRNLGVNARQEIFSRGFLWARNAERAIALAEQWKSMRPVRRDLSR